MVEIYVDADACPVKDETMQVAARHSLKTYLVSDGGIRPPQIHLWNWSLSIKARMLPTTGSRITFKKLTSVSPTTSHWLHGVWNEVL